MYAAVPRSGGRFVYRQASRDGHRPAQTPMVYLEPYSGKLWTVVTSAQATNLRLITTSVTDGVFTGRGAGMANTLIPA
jgi:hypothetical protein